MNFNLQILISSGKIINRKYYYLQYSAKVGISVGSFSNYNMNSNVKFTILYYICLKQQLKIFLICFRMILEPKFVQDYGSIHSTSSDGPQQHNTQYNPVNKLNSRSVTLIDDEEAPNTSNITKMVQSKFLNIYSTLIKCLETTLRF